MYILIQSCNIIHPCFSLLRIYGILQQFTNESSSAELDMKRKLLVCQSDISRLESRLQMLKHAIGRRKVLPVTRPFLSEAQISITREILQRQWVALISKIFATFKFVANLMKLQILARENVFSSCIVFYIRCQWRIYFRFYHSLLNFSLATIKNLNA